MTKNLSKYSLFTLITFFIAGCGGSVAVNNEEAVDANPATLSSRISNSVSALVPSINESEVSASLTPDLVALTYGSSSGWSNYLTPENSHHITDIFGSASESPAVVTKIRVLTELFTEVTSQILVQDPDFECDGSSAFNGGDDVTIAFYGSISNGPSTNRYFDCKYNDQTVTLIYGKDASNVRRFVMMGDEPDSNSQDADVRGDEKRIRQTIYITYAENTSGGLPITYVDLQYAQLTSYNGPDLNFSTSDDVLFKSRSRISGRVQLTEAGNVSSGSGEFQVTKYDTDGSYTNITKVIGRGSFGSGSYSIFKIDSDATELVSSAGAYCLQMNSGAIPTNVASSNCSTLESSYAWGSASFPFTLSPTLPTTFDNKAYFEGNNTDMIANSGSNFTIPTY